MEIIKKEAAIVITNGGVTAAEYEMNNPDLNVARIQVNGRYHEVGYTANKVVDSIVHVIGGRGIITTMNNGAQE